jgi:hypothetical protein
MFNIIINSQKSNPTFSSASNNDLTFLFNWTNIPQGKYEMRWTLKSDALGDNLLAIYNPQVELTLGSIPTTYVGGQLSQSYIINYIGTLRSWVDPTQQGFFFSNLTDNSPTFYTSVPTDERIRVRMFNSDFITLFTATAFPEYVMFLSFTKIG